MGWASYLEDIIDRHTDDRATGGVSVVAKPSHPGDMPPHGPPRGKRPDLPLAPLSRQVLDPIDDKIVDILLDIEKRRGDLRQSVVRMEERLLDLTMEFQVEAGRLAQRHKLETSLVHKAVLFRDLKALLARMSGFGLDVEGLLVGQPEQISSFVTQLLARGSQYVQRIQHLIDTLLVSCGRLPEGDRERRGFAQLLRSGEDTLREWKAEWEQVAKRLSSCSGGVTKAAETCVDLYLNLHMDLDIPDVGDSKDPA